MNRTFLVALLVLAFSLSLISTAPNAAGQALGPAAEARAVGGIDNCMRAWGLGVALGIASLSGCGVLCATAAWYDLALIGAYC